MQNFYKDIKNQNLNDKTNIKLSSVLMLDLKKMKEKYVNYKLIYKIIKTNYN